MTAAGPSVGSELGPSVAVLGPFDAADYGELLTGKIVARELRARLPFARVDLYAPLGAKRRIALDGGSPALPLGPPDRSMRAKLAARHDLVVIEGNVVHTHDDLYAHLYGISVEEAERLRPSGFFVDGLGPELERRCPVAWYGVAVPSPLDGAAADRAASALESRRRVSVRDQRSREFLAEAAEAAGATEITVVPHPAVLAERLFPAEVLRKRLGYLRAMGWYPAEGSPILVQAEGPNADAAAEVAREMAAGAPIVLLALEPSRDDRLADTTDAVVPDRPYRLPAEVTLEDVTAAIAHAAEFVGTSDAGRMAALSFGVRSRTPGEEAKVESLGRLQERADAELDALAALAENEWATRATSERTASELLRALEQAEARYQALLRAYEERGERLLRERMQYAEIVDGLEAAAGGRSPDVVSREAELETRLEIAAAAEAEARFELERARARGARAERA